MGGQIEDLLSLVNRQYGGVERLLEQVLQHRREDAAEIKLLRERLAALEKTEEHDLEEHREVKDRLGSGDHTFAALQSKVAVMEEVAKLRDEDIEGLYNSNRRLAALVRGLRTRRALWAAVIPTVVGAVAAILTKLIGG